MPMTVERDIDYEAMAQSAMRGMVRSVLMRVAKSGLPGEHHFYIAFNTTAPGVVISKRLREKYPEEMTVVLQHRFWDLIVSEDRFEVKLTFDSIPERLAVPFTAIKVFFDPSVPYGLQFEGSDLAEASAADVEETAAEPASRPIEKKPRAQRKPRAERRTGGAATEPGSEKAPAKPRVVASRPETPEPTGNDNKIVSLDKFRKK
jgi:hypothetical protein